MKTKIKSVIIAYHMAVGHRVAAAMVCALCAVGLSASAEQEPVTYLDWSDEKKSTTNATCTAYEILTTESENLAAGTTYVVQEEVEVWNRLKVNGTAASPTRIIICDNATLTARKGIAVEATDAVTNAVVICSQSKKTGVRGVLEAYGDSGCAGIGGTSRTPGSSDCGIVTIMGCKITVEGGYGGCAGIGGAVNGKGGIVTIDGGTLDVKGWTAASGVGGGFGGNGGMLTINNGTLNATGGDGGEVVANTMGGGGAGVGSGFKQWSASELGDAGVVTVNGGTLNATGGASDAKTNYGGGAGIGGAYRTSGAVVTVNGGTVTAIGGLAAAGIGSGFAGADRTLPPDGGRLTVNGGTVTATGGTYGPGIGGGLYADGAAVTLNGGTVTAAGGAGKTVFAAIGSALGTAGSVAFGADYVVNAGADETSAAYVAMTTYAAGHQNLYYVSAQPTGRELDKAQYALETAFGTAAVVESVYENGVLTGHRVSLTADVNDGLTLPEDLGAVEIDLNGWKLCGSNGAAGTETTAGGDGSAAITVTGACGADAGATTISVIGERQYLGVPTNADGFDYTTDGVTVIPGDYCVVDLETGAVTEMSNVKDGTIFNADEYKTTKMVFRHVPDGKFKAYTAKNDGSKTMVANDIALSEYWVAVFTVTEGQYEMLKNGSISSATPKMPKLAVKWNDFRGGDWTGWDGTYAHVPAPGAGTVVDALNTKVRSAGSAAKFDLATSFQLERAERAGTWSDYFFDSSAKTTSYQSDEFKALNDYAWYTKNSGGEVHEVGLKKPNAWGLYDVYGNVYEFSMDWYAMLTDNAGYAKDYCGPVTSPDTKRVKRGGRYNNCAGHCSSVSRYGHSPSSNKAADTVGYRLVRIASRPASGTAAGVVGGNGGDGNPPGKGASAVVDGDGAAIAPVDPFGLVSDGADGEKLGGEAQVSPEEPIVCETADAATNAMKQAVFVPSTAVAEVLVSDGAKTRYEGLFKLEVEPADGQWAVAAVLKPEAEGTLAETVSNVVAQIPASDIATLVGNTATNLVFAGGEPGFYYSLYSGSAVTDLTADANAKNINVLCGENAQVVFPEVVKQSEESGFFSVGVKVGPTVKSGDGR